MTKLTEQEEAGFRIGIRVAAQHLEETAADYEQMASHTGTPGLGAAHRRLKEQAELLRGQAKLIREYTPDQVKRNCR